MIYVKYMFFSILVLFTLILLGIAVFSGKPLRVLLLNAAIGITAFVAVNLLSRFTGVHIPVNEYSAGCASVLGIPGVCGLLILQLIMGF